MHRDSSEHVVWKEQTEAGGAGAGCQGGKGQGGTWRGGQGQTCRRLLDSWNMKKEAIWRILTRAVNLRFLKTPLDAAWKGDWMQGQQCKEGSRRILHSSSWR